MKASLVVLGLFPFVRGFGWMLIESQTGPLDWGVVERKMERTRNARCLKTAERLLLRYRPHVLVLEAFDHRTSMRSQRIRRLCRSLVSRCHEWGAEPRILTRREVHRAFAEVHPHTRFDLARIVAARVKPIEARLPQKRRSWESDHPNMALFNAAALALAWHAIAEKRST